MEAGVGNQELNFGHVKFDLLITYSSGKGSNWIHSAGVQKEAETGDIHLGVTFL